MAIYKVKLKGCQEIASGTMAFHFEKPGGSRTRRVSSAISLCLPAGQLTRKGTCGFSLATAPYEDDLMVATRMRDTAFSGS